jgi:hypothetical protein
MILQGHFSPEKSWQNVGSIRAAEENLYSFLLEFQVLETFSYCAMVVVMTLAFVGL